MSKRSPFGTDSGVSSLAPFGVVLTVRGRLSDVSPALLEETARREKLVVLRGLDAPDRDLFLAFCRSFPGRSLLGWDFGPVMEMREHPDAKNYLFSREPVPFHWDGAFHEVPSYLMFHCVEAPVEGAGGETLFCDTTRVWAGASAEEQALFRKVELTYQTKKLAHYGGKVTGPLVQEHPATGQTILRFAEAVQTALNPVSMQVSGIPDGLLGEFVEKMTRRIYSPEYCYKHAWRPGDLLMADNHALIHGRTAFEKDCPRHLRRIQVM